MYYSYFYFTFVPIVMFSLLAIGVSMAMPKLDFHRRTRCVETGEFLKMWRVGGILLKLAVRMKKCENIDDP